MSKRAEEMALKAFPPNIVDLYGEPCDAQAGNRQRFIQGYEQAEKDTIKKAIEWLKYARDKKMSIDGAIAYFKAIMEDE